MKISFLKNKIILALCLCFIIGLISIPALVNSHNKQSKYNINANGQTYGSDLLANSIEDEPDLIAATGVGGIEGYVKSVDLNGKMPKNPEEAAKIQEENSKRKEPREIPLYKSDGETVIGKFRMSIPKVTLTRPDGTKVNMD